MSKPDIETKVVRYLGRWPSGLTTTRMRAWIDSCRRDGGYSSSEYEGALYSLRDSGRVACVNGVWYLKDISTVMKESANDRQHQRDSRRRGHDVSPPIRSDRQVELASNRSGSETGTDLSRKHGSD